MALNHFLRLLITGTLCTVLLACGSDQTKLSPLSESAKILAFGDSLTQGTGASTDQSYPAVLSRLTGRIVINAGIPGELSSDGLKRLPKVLAATRPQLMILCHGGNDMLRKQDLNNAARNIESMIRLAQAQGVEVLLIGVPKPGLFLGTADLYPTIATTVGIPAEHDVLADILSDPSLKSDPIHPNGSGYQRMAEAVVSVLERSGAL